MNRRGRMNTAGKPKAGSDKLGIAYHLVPPESIRRLALVFTEGLRKYPDNAINFRNIMPAVNDDAWQTERFNHAVDHLLKWMAGDNSEDHLAKVMWFCAVMITIDQIREQRKAK